VDFLCRAGSGLSCATTRAHLVTETMERNPDIGFSSYDRFFPSQDNMPAGGFGNLIALPLQHGPRLAGRARQSTHPARCLSKPGVLQCVRHAALTFGIPRVVVCAELLAHHIA
jgi:hypothetical protein